MVRDYGDLGVSAHKVASLMEGGSDPEQFSLHWSITSLGVGVESSSGHY